MTHPTSDLINASGCQPVAARFLDRRLAFQPDPENVQRGVILRGRTLPCGAHQDYLETSRGLRCTCGREGRARALSDGNDRHEASGQSRRHKSHSARPASKASLDTPQASASSCASSRTPKPCRGFQLATAGSAALNPWNRRDASLSVTPSRTPCIGFSSRLRDQTRGETPREAWSTCKSNTLSQQA